MSTILKNIYIGILTVGLTVLTPTLATAGSCSERSLKAAEQLTMGALVKAVVVQNAGLAEMRAAANAAEQRIIPSGALDDPFLSYALAPGTLNGLITPAGQSRGLNQRIEISQIFPWPGKLGLREDTAKYEAEAAGENINATYLRLIAASKISYTQWYYIHRALEVNTANLSLLEELREVAENRYATGLTGQQDVLQAEVRIQELKRQRLDMIRIKQQVAAQINTLLNDIPGTRVPPPSALPPLQQVPDMKVLQATAMAHHPELEAIEYMVTANEARTKLAKKEFLPDFKIFTGYNSLWDNPDKRWVVGVGINLPIGQSKRRAAVAEARANTLRYEYQLDNRRAQLLGQLQQTHATLTQALDTYTLYEQQLTPRTRENLSAARSEYSSGGGSFLDVITAEEQKLNAELGTQRARADYFIALADLERWAGGKLPDVAFNNLSEKGDTP